MGRHPCCLSGEQFRTENASSFVMVRHLPVDAMLYRRNGRRRPTVGLLIGRGLVPQATRRRRSVLIGQVEEILARRSFPRAALQPSRRTVRVTNFVQRNSWPSLSSWSNSAKSRSRVVVERITNRYWLFCRENKRETVKETEETKGICRVLLDQACRRQSLQDRRDV